MNIYLENEICQFIPLKPIDYTVKKNIIVTSLFKMAGGGYKSFSKYLDGIKILSEMANKNNMSVRIFIDQTIHDDNVIMKYLNKFDNVILILYKCNAFLINKHHVGVFGTLVRFFPLFDFPNNDANIVFLADADTKYQYISDLINLYTKLKKLSGFNNNYLAYNGRYFHVNINSKKITNLLKKYNKTIYLPYCIAQKFFGIKRIPVKPFIRFFKKVKLYMDDKTRPTKILTDYFISKTNYIKKCQYNICFGLDEYFLNKVLFKYFLKKKMPFCYSNNFNLAQYYYFKYPNNINKDLLTVPFDEYKKKFNNIISMAGLDKYSYNTIDKSIYVAEDDSSNTNTIASDFMTMFATKFIPVLKKLEKEQNYSIITKSQYYSMNMIDYTKYFQVRYLHFINSNIDDIIVSSIKYKHPLNI